LSVCSVAWEKGDKISFTDPVQVDPSSSSAYFQQKMCQVSPPRVWSIVKLHRERVAPKAALSNLAVSTSFMEDQPGQPLLTASAYECMDSAGVGREQVRE
jgi:hypothetical protein